MSAHHEFECDKCKRRVSATYNGEHYIAPMGWVELYDHLNASLTGKHLCVTCNPLKKKEEKKK